MRKQSQCTLVAAVMLIGSPALLAQPDLQRQLKDENIGSHWIYDDIAKGFAQAKAGGKPLLVLFR